MRKLICLSFLTVCLATFTFANNVQVSNINVYQNATAGGYVAFTVAWDNSWHLPAGSGPSNWDAVWIFIKFEDCFGGPNIDFSQGILDSTTSKQSYTGMDAMTTVTGVGGNTESAVEGSTLDFTTGIMLRRTSTGIGSFSSRDSLRIINLPANTVPLTVHVEAIEMVYVPQNNFSLGDGTSSFGFCSSASSSVPLNIDSTFETVASTIYINYNGAAVTPEAAVPAAFPKGQYGFYIMKYEITEGLYCEFLNTINAAAQANRNLGNIGTNRNQTTYTVATNIATTTRPDRAQNWLSWADYSALLDWAALRPYTELEYEKACRGNGAYFSGEFAWGGAGAVEAVNISGAENGAETITTPSANCSATNITYTGVGSDAGTGPLRSGIFATASTVSSSQTGGSFYGIMELSGNIREFVVMLSSTAANNTFTRSWGDGVLTGQGTQNAATWPASGYALIGNVNGCCSNGTTSFQNSVGTRGGDWFTGANRMRVSDRVGCYCSNGNGCCFGTDELFIAREKFNGGRGAR